ncbi:hypothetical protein CS022_12335 [Veronia nyctiphanis]|uniref:Uncharacterized protein n=1 Tax=Veronia nyctiphanis TaxID=1278244 RepID=A0A4Q0YVQ8_9GAMM|nr:hypothetical protein [Veronia nyctiphanis]RXJ73061.1 hypothetical protein CS022_12335 [Veronia nyctiphanis]
MTIAVNGKKRKVCLVLQGGGALGAYQIGVYKAYRKRYFRMKIFTVLIGLLAFQLVRSTQRCSPLTKNLIA